MSETCYFLLYDLRMHTHSIAIEIRPSVCLSVKCVHSQKTKETSAHIFISYERSVLFFQQQEWLVGFGPFYLKFLHIWGLLEGIVVKFCIVVGVPDVITHAFLGDD